MSDAELERRMAELDRLLNAPAVRMDPPRVWAMDCSPWAMLTTRAHCSWASGS